MVAKISRHSHSKEMLVRFMVLAGGVLFPAAWGHGEEPRQLAPGVVRVVPAEIDASDTVSDPFVIHGLAEAAEAWTPATIPPTETLQELAKRAVIHHPVWQLEFGFKPVRMLRTQWTEPDGSSRSGLVWYMVYYVRNLGGHLHPKPETTDWKTEYKPEPTDHAVRFVPAFTLEAHDQKKAYIDRVRPQVVKAIQAREDRDVKLHNSVDISRIALEPRQGADGKVWGVATWMDVDPRIDFFSVYVQGLTNAYRWEEERPENLPPQAPPDLARRTQPKTLQINFYRPSDARHEHEGEIFLGPPTHDDPVVREQMLAMYRLQSPLEYLWIYR